MSQALFIAGPLADGALRQCILGADLPLRAAHLPGARLVAAAPLRLAAVAPGDGVAGHLAHLPAEAQARLMFYAQASGVPLISRQVVCGGAAVAAQVLAPEAPGGAPWDAAAWASQAPMVRAAAGEVMARLGSDVAQVAAHYGSILGRAWAGHMGTAPRPRSLGTPLASADVVVRQRRPRHLGFFRLDQVALEVPRFDGTRSPPLERELYIGHDAAVVLPYDPAADAVVLLEQFRIGLWGRGTPDPTSLEPIAGLVDAGETPAEAAHREAREEAGLEIAELLPLPGGYASPGYVTDYFHCFLALCTLPPQAEWYGGLAGEEENIRVHRLPFERAMALVRSGEIDVIPTVMLLLWLAQYRQGA